MQNIYWSRIGLEGSIVEQGTTQSSLLKRLAGFAGSQKIASRRYAQLQFWEHSTTCRPFRIDWRQSTYACPPNQTPASSGPQARNAGKPHLPPFQYFTKGEVVLMVICKVLRGILSIQISWSKMSIAALASLFEKLFSTSHARH